MYLFEIYYDNLFLALATYTFNGPTQDQALRLCIFYVTK